MDIEELQVTGHAVVTSIDACPAIADGEGSVVTARFVTRQVDTIARVEILSADGQIEVLEGTTIHAIWLPSEQLRYDFSITHQRNRATSFGVILLAGSMPRL